jgi:hypothetical protein
MVSKIGVSMFEIRHAICDATTRAAPKISNPLNKATRALAAHVAPMRAKLSAYVTASPKLSSAPDSKDEEPLKLAAVIIMRKVVALMMSTSISTRR